jgi:mevalonate pyrophosphate decarboxylase
MATTRTTTEKKRPPLTPSTLVAAVTTKKLKTDIVELSSDAGGGSASGGGAGSGGTSGSGTDYIAKYLSNSNKTFEDIISPIFQNTANPFNIEDLRQIAHLEYKLKLIDLNSSLWTTYLRSGTGKLNEDQQLQIGAAIAEGITTTSVRHNPFIWSLELKKIILDDPNENFIPNAITHDQYLSYVMKKLRTFREQNTSYQTQLKERKQHLSKGTI